MTGDYFHKDITEIDFKETPTTFGTGGPVSSALIAGNSGLWDRYLESKEPVNPFPRNFDDFVAQWRAFPKVDSGLNATPELSDTISDDFLAASRDELKALLETDTDWADITYTDEEFDELVKGAFGTFLRGFPYEEIAAASGGALTSADFFAEWEKFLTVTAVVLDASAVGAKEGLATFEAVYRSFFPDGDFVARLNEFFEAHMRGHGYFLPSHHIDDWTRAIQVEFRQEKPISISADEKRRRNVMLLVFKILRKVLERLQETVQVQARRLEFLAKLQAEYTKLMGRVPLYQANPPRLVGSLSLWESVLDHDELSSFAYAQIKSGIGSLGESTWADKGFAGITLEEIREAGLLFPTVFGYSEAQIAAASAAAAQGLGTALPRGQQTIPEDFVFYDLKGQEFPGVWWLVEQPYDGSGKYGGSPKADMEHRQDLNQVRQQWIEGLRSHRNIDKHDANQAQTDMSQTQEAINQQSNLMTSIIQQLSAIIQGIFK